MPNILHRFLVGNENHQRYAFKDYQECYSKNVESWATVSISYFTFQKCVDDNSVFEHTVLKDQNRNSRLIEKNIEKSSIKKN